MKATERLTEKRGDFYYDLSECFISDCSNKLGKLEDVEEEFGIDLAKLLAARKVYYMAWNGNGDGIEIRETYSLLINLTERKVEYYRNRCSDFAFDLEFKNYGKKDIYGGWAFTKEELE